MGKCASLRLDNRFQFACPIFGATVELRGCMKLLELQMISKRVETRQGCQAAMSASKCPTWHLQQLALRGEDEWFSAEPKVGELGDKLIARIERVQVTDRDIARYEVPTREREMLAASNTMHERGGKKPAKAAPVPIAPVVVPPAPSASDDALIAAASSGSLAAAVNRAAASAEIGAGGTSTASARKPRSRAA